MTSSGEVAIVIAIPILILGLFVIEPISVLVAYWMAREQRRRDILAGIDPDDASPARREGVESEEGR